MRKFITGAALAVALTLQGCGEQKSDGDPAASAQSGETDLAKALDDKDDLSTLSDALKTTGLNGIFANAGSYTLIAPTDAAFAQLGDKAKALDSDQGSAALTTVVRNHLVPGYLTRDDIAKAIEANAGKPVRMTTLGSTELEFAQTDGAITVTAEDGTKGRLAGDPVAAGPSIALPVDTVLKQL
jgi:uncharacterized surface protein with fasciclin (FAS1) repeats